MPHTRPRNGSNSKYFFIVKSHCLFLLGKISYFNVTAIAWSSMGHNGLMSSNCILFHCSKKNHAIDVTTIKLGDETIPRVPFTKYVGLTIDENLHELFITQNKLLKVLTQKNYRYSTNKKIA